MIGTLAIDWWDVAFGTARRDLCRLHPPRCTKCNSTPNHRPGYRLHIIWCGTI